MECHFANRLAMLAAALFGAATALSAADGDYTYKLEGFEDAAWDAPKNTTVTTASGLWGCKSKRNTDKYAGSMSICITDKGSGLTTPKLAQGCGTIIYYAQNTGTKVTIATAGEDKQFGTVLRADAEKQQFGWTKFIFTVNDANVRYVKWTTADNSKLFIDDLIVTKLDGTDADGTAWVVNERLPYFVEDFEGSTTFPKADAADNNVNAAALTASGDWKMFHAGKEGNDTYLPDGSTAGLRILKNDGYVVTPELPQGVVALSFEAARGNQLTISGSSNGTDWTELTVCEPGSATDLLLNEQTVRYLKIANTENADCSLDNLRIFAFPAGQKGTVGTGTATDIKSSRATAPGTITAPGDKKLCSVAVEWGRKTGLYTTLVEGSFNSGSTTEFTAALTGLPAESSIYYRSVLTTLAGVSYGEEKTLTTLAAIAPKLTMDPVIQFDAATTDKLIGVQLNQTIDDEGGAPLTKQGFVYCLKTDGEPSLESQKSVQVSAPSGRMQTGAIGQIPQGQEYNFRAYAVNSVGTSYSATVAWTAPTLQTKTYAHNTYWLAPDGNDETGDGTKAKPWFHISKAAEKAVAGDVINMKPGVYKYIERQELHAIGEKGDGMITLQCPDEFANEVTCTYSGKTLKGRAVLDFSKQDFNGANYGIWLTGSYWHLYKLDIYGAGDNGLLIERIKKVGVEHYAEVVLKTEQAHDNLIEFCRFIWNRDSGLQMKNWATYNRVVNCDAFWNSDWPNEGENADGFAVKISHGSGNYFYGCRSWDNSDDGWDQYYKSADGYPDDQWTVYENCWAFHNGYGDKGTEPLQASDGNGFKTGSKEGRNNVILNRCLAFENLHKGFDQNSNTGSIIMNNCTAWAHNNGLSKGYPCSYRFGTPVAPGHEVRLTNCLAVLDKDDVNMQSKKPTYAINDLAASVKTTSCDLHALPEYFMSLDTAKAQAWSARDESGNLPDLKGFAHINTDNADAVAAWVDKGVEVAKDEDHEPWNGIGIRFNGAKPDLGCFETGDALPELDLSKPIEPFNPEAEGKDPGVRDPEEPTEDDTEDKGALRAVEAAPTVWLDVTVCHGGLLLCQSSLGANGAEWQLAIVDTQGRTIVRRSVTGGAAAVTVPAKGIYVAVAYTSDKMASRKVSVK